MQVEKTPNHGIVLTQTLAEPCDAVFAVLTEAGHLPRWTKSAGMSLVTCDVDLRVGGSFRYVFQRSSGFKIEVRGAYQEVEPPRRFVYTESYDSSPITILVTTTLDTTSEGTLFRQTLRYASTQERDEDFDTLPRALRRLMPTWRNI